MLDVRFGLLYFLEDGWESEEIHELRIEFRAPSRENDVARCFRRALGAVTTAMRYRVEGVGNGDDAG
jgi:hypothetical protein